jgi:type II secretory pathway pseudopilin PulG
MCEVCCAKKTRSSGFVITDVIALVAVSGVAAAVMPAVMSTSRVSAQRSQNVANHRLLGKAQGMYMAENLDQYAGLNTSGAAFQGIGFQPTGAVFFTDALYGDTSATTPTSTWDWISPILGEKGRFPANRAGRLAEILDRLADPAATRTIDSVFLSGEQPDFEDFNAAFSQSIPQVSYLQPASFHLFSSAADPDSIPEAGPAGGDFLFRTSLRQASGDLPAVTPPDFRPVLDRVATSLSSKVLHADGTRFLDADNRLSINADADPFVLGNFASFGPILESSTAYGRSALGSPGNLELTFRQRVNGQTGIHATMFDGSVRFMTQEESWTDPAPWYPSGSVFTGNDATAESIEFADANYEGILP